MAATTGLVQYLLVQPGGTYACVYVGPSPAFVEAFFVMHEATDTAHSDAFKASMIDGLAQALASRREVTVNHGDIDSRIDSLELR